MSTNLSSLITNSIPGAQGEKNYLATGASTSQGWTASGAGITVGTDTTAANLPRPNTTATGIKFTGVSGSTAYAYYRFILDDADAGKKLKVQFDMKPGTAVASDFKIDVYSNTASDYTTGNTRLSLSTDSSAVSALPALTGTYRTTFDAPAVTAKWIEVRIGMNASATHTLYLSDFIVGPGVVVQGAAVGPWATYTPTVTGMGTVSVVYAEWRRNAENIEIRGKITAGTPTGVALKITLPTGYTGRVASGTATGTGSAGADYNGTNYAGLVPIFTSSDNTNIQFGYNNARDVASPVTANSILSPGSTFWYTVAVPCNEFAGSGTVNVVQNDMMYAYNSSTTTADDTTSFGYGPGGVLFQSFAPSGITYITKRVRFPYPVSSGASPHLEIYDGTAWVNVTERIGGWGADSGATIAWGTRITPVSATDYDVGFYARYSQATTNTWSGLAGWKWRVSAAAPGVAIGFSEVNPGVSSGLVSASGLKGNATGNAIATGYVGEKITSSAWNTQTSSTTIADITSASITLSAGIWLIYAQVHSAIEPTRATAGSAVNLTVSLTNSSNVLVGAGMVEAAAYQHVSGVTQGSTVTAHHIVENVNISSSTTYKLRLVNTETNAPQTKVIYGSADASKPGAFYAVRIA